MDVLTNDLLFFLYVFMDVMDMLLFPFEYEMLCELLAVMVIYGKMRMSRLVMCWL
jgi:hypothetical protein